MLTYLEIIKCMTMLYIKYMIEHKKTDIFRVKK